MSLGRSVSIDYEGRIQALQDEIEKIEKDSQIRTNDEVLRTAERAAVNKADALTRQES